MPDKWNPVGWSSTAGSNSTQPPILVIGLGNPILGDDGVGWTIAHRVQALLAEMEEGANNQITIPIEIDSLAVGGLGLMERMVGYDRAILIDAITTRQNPLGSVLSFSLETLPNLTSGHLSSSHDASIQDALSMGRTMGARLPRTIMVVAIESEFVYDFSEQLSPEVTVAIPNAVKIVLQLLTDWSKE